MKKIHLIIFIALFLLNSCGNDKNSTSYDNYEYLIELDGNPIKTSIEDFEIINGDWKLENGKLFQNSLNYDGSIDRIIIYKKFNGKYYAVSTDMTVTDDSGASNYSIGLLFKVNDQNNYYYVYLGQSGEIALAKLINGNWTLLHSQNFDSLPIGTKINLKIKLTPDNISVYTDDTFRYSVQIQANEFEIGKIGFMTGWGATGKFENVKIITN